MPTILSSEEEEEGSLHCSTYFVFAFKGIRGGIPFFLLVRPRLECYDVKGKARLVRICTLHSSVERKRKTYGSSWRRRSINTWPYLSIYRQRKPLGSERPPFPPVGVTKSAFRVRIQRGRHGQLRQRVLGSMYLVPFFGGVVVDGRWVGVVVEFPRSSCPYRVCLFNVISPISLLRC